MKVFIISGFRAQSAHDEGQALVEYALILMLVAVVCVGVLSAIGLTVVGFLEETADAFGP